MRLTTVLIGLGILASSPAFAQVEIKDPQVSMKVRDHSQAYLLGTFTSVKENRITGASSPVAGMVHTHLSRQGEDGKMQVISGIPLSSKQPRTLSRYGYHLMMTGVKRPLKVGTKIPVTLLFSDSNKQTIQFKVVR